MVLTYLRYSLSLGDILISDLHSGVAQTLEHVSRVETKQVGNFVGLCIFYMKERMMTNCTDSEYNYLQQTWTLEMSSGCFETFSTHPLCHQAQPAPHAASA